MYRQDVPYPDGPGEVTESVGITIRCETDAETFQNDLDKLAEWEKKWMMAFHPSKCQVLHVTCKRNVSRHTYTLNGHQLESVDSCKYLGVTITSDLRWNQHVGNITSKANRTLGFLRRNLKINYPALKTTAYQALVRPLVKYSSTVWDPHTQRGTHQIEMVQWQVARYVLNRHHNTSSVVDMLGQLGW